MDERRRLDTERRSLLHARVERQKRETQDLIAKSAELAERHKGMMQRVQDKKEMKQYSHDEVIRRARLVAQEQNASAAPMKDKQTPSGTTVEDERSRIRRSLLQRARMISSQRQEASQLEEDRRIGEKKTDEEEDDNEEEKEEDNEDGEEELSESVGEVPKGGERRKSNHQDQELEDDEEQDDDVDEEKKVKDEKEEVEERKDHEKEKELKLARERSMKRIRIHRQKERALAENQSKSTRTTSTRPSTSDHMTSSSTRSHSRATVASSSRGFESDPRVFEKWKEGMDRRLSKAEDTMKKLLERGDRLDAEEQEMEERFMKEENELIRKLESAMNHAKKAQEGHEKSSEELKCYLREYRNEKEAIQEELGTLEREKTSIHEQKDALLKEREQRKDYRSTRQAQLDRDIRKAEDDIERMKVDLESRTMLVERLRDEIRSLKQREPVSLIGNLEHPEQIAASETVRNLVPLIRAGHENIARLRKEMESYMQKKEALESDLAGIRQKEESFRNEFTLEMEVAHSEIDFLREKAKTHQKLSDIAEKRDNVDDEISSIRDRLSSRISENERLKHEFAARKHEYETAVQSRGEQRQSLLSMIESRADELERARSTVAHLDAEMKEKDAEEKIRFEVILRQEKLVEAEFQTFLEVWKREHDALTSRLASLTQASKTSSLKALDERKGQIRSQLEKLNKEMEKNQKGLEVRRKENKEQLDIAQDDILAKRDEVSQLQEHKLRLESVIYGSASHEVTDEDLSPKKEEYHDICVRLKRKEEEMMSLQKKVVELSEKTRILITGDASMQKLEKSIADLKEEDSRLDSRRRMLQREGDAGRAVASVEENEEIVKIKRLIEEKILEREAKTRIINRWKAQVSEQNVRMASEVSNARKPLLQSLAYEKEKCQSLERAIEEARTRLKAFDDEKGSTLENWHDHTLEERRRIDSFDEEIGSIQEELSEILRQRAALQGEIEAIQARDLELDHQQRMKRASHEIRLMQFERERVEEYEREHRHTFESWSEKYGEDKAARLVQEQLKEIEQLHRKQVQERRQYFMRLIDRLEKLPDDILNLSQKIRQLRSDLEAATNDVTDMEKVVEKEMSGQITQWQQQMTSLREKLSSEEAEIERLHRDQDRTVTALRRYDEERRDFELSLQKAQSDVTIIEKENRLQERLEKLAESISARSAAQIGRVAKLKEQIAELRQVDQECADNDEKARRVVEELQSTLKQIPDDRKKEKQRIKGIRRRLRERIASKEAEINHLVGQIAEKEGMYKRRMRSSVPSSQQGVPSVSDDDGRAGAGGDDDADDADDKGEGPIGRSRKGAKSSTSGTTRDRRGLTLEELEEEADETLRRLQLDAQRTKSTQPRGGSSEKGVAGTSRGAVVPTDDRLEAMKREIEARKREVERLERESSTFRQSTKLRDVLEIEDRRIFGPHSEPLTLEQVQKLQEVVVFMLKGSEIYKRSPPNRRDSVEVNGVTIPAGIRRLSLSNDFSRLEIQQEGKRLPESFVKVEHILRMEPNRPRSTLIVQGAGDVFAIVLKDKQFEFMSLDPEIHRLWVDGLKMLLARRKQLFYLKFNLKRLLGAEFLREMTASKG